MTRSRRCPPRRHGRRMARGRRRPTRRRGPSAPARRRSRRPAPTLISSPGSIANALPAMAIETKMTGDRDRQRDDVPNSFSSAMRRRDQPVGGDELEAATRRLGGERARQGEDRPQAQHEREERAVLVLEGSRPACSTLTACPARPAGSAARPDERRHLGARLRRVELGRRSPCVTPMKRSRARPPTTIVARRESRIVLPKTLPRPIDAAPERRSG